MRKTTSTGPLRWTDRQGAAAAEFAIMAPLMILLCLTSVDFGRFSYAYIALGNAARVGGEVGATKSYSASNAATWKAQVEDAVREDFKQIGGLEPQNLSIDVAVVEESISFHRHTVSVAYPFSTVVAWPGIPQPLRLERSITYRRFR